MCQVSTFELKILRPWPKVFESLGAAISRVLAMVLGKILQSTWWVGGNCRGQNTQLDRERDGVTLERIKMREGAASEWSIHEHEMCTV